MKPLCMESRYNRGELLPERRGERSRGRHRKDAEDLILQLANSFEQEDPRQKSLLSAATVLRIFGRLRD